MFALGNCVLVHLHMRGVHAGDLWSLPPAHIQIAPPLRPTHTGEFTDVAPTGCEVVLPVTALFRVRGNTIVEHRLRYDADDLLRQLGISRHPSEMGDRHGRRIPL